MRKKDSLVLLIFILISVVWIGTGIALVEQPKKETKDMSALFSVGTYIYEGQVVRWVDGDTIVLKVDLGFNITFTDKFRLLDVDTPERGQKDFDESVKIVNEYAPKGSKIYVWSHKTPKRGKYGRWLAVIYNEDAKEQDSNGKSINEILTEKGWYYGWK